MTRIFSFVCLLSTLLIGSAWAAEATPKLTPASAVTTAASQRQYAERMAKAYAQIGLDLRDNDPKKQMEAASKQFASQLAQLKAYASNAEIKENYTALEQTWSEYKAVLGMAPTTITGQKLMEINEEVIGIAQQGAGLIEVQQPGVGEVKLARLSADVATLSQRLAKICLYQGWGVKQPLLNKDLAAAREEFLAIMKQLKAAPQSTGSIKAQIDMVETQWVFFQQAIDALDKAKSDPTLLRNVATSSERIYEVATGLVSQYQKVAH